MDIHVLMTNICSQESVVSIGTLLNHHPMVVEWSVDMEDTDRVLRAVTTSLSQEELIALICSIGFVCTSLPE